METMNPTILTQVHKFPPEKQAEIFTIILQRLDNKRPKVDEMYKPIVKRFFTKYKKK